MNKQQFLSNPKSSYKPNRLLALLFFAIGAVHIYSRIHKNSQKTNFHQNYREHIIALESKYGNSNPNRYWVVGVVAAIAATVVELYIN